jgi:uncharacterized membrane protein (DUF485 family)
MAHFDASAPSHQETETADIAQRNSRYGLVLFFLYFALYVGFMVLSAFFPEVIRTEVAGVSLGIVYGMGLILAAIVFSAVYLWLCRGPVRN